MKELKGIVDLGITFTKTELLVLVGMSQYYRYMWHRWYHMLAPLTKVTVVPKGRKYYGMKI